MWYASVVVCLFFHLLDYFSLSLLLCTLIKKHYIRHGYDYCRQQLKDVISVSFNFNICVIPSKSKSC